MTEPAARTDVERSIAERSIAERAIVEQDIVELAPAKVNLTLHVTGQRADGYHLLDSLVVFADVGDRVRVRPADAMALSVVGPLAQGVPDDARNLCWKAAKAFGQPVAIRLEKHLPAAAGIGGGSSDAAAVLRAMGRLFAQPAALDPMRLGADVPVCLDARAARMQGVGERLTPVGVPPLHAVLVNPGVAVETPKVFAQLPCKTHPPMSELPTGAGFLDWLAMQRNDLQTPAITLQPVIGTVLERLSALNGVRLVRMSGSGATCFGIFANAEAARQGAQALQDAQPNWWVRACVLN